MRAGRPDYEETVIPGWIEGSKTARETLECDLDVRYGEGPKQKLDVFRCGSADAPTLIYFHGGYWQRGDRSVYSFLAEPFVRSGISMAPISYDLCPDVELHTIAPQVRRAVTHLWTNREAYGIRAERFSIMGHSAGGHITQMMMATDWPDYDPDLPRDLMKSGIPVSPLSYLEPVRLTEALNTGIRMDPTEAHDQSPMTLHPPITDAPQMVVVGGAETEEFHRQSRMYVDKYGSAERTIDLYIVPDVDHFDELNVLADPTSVFFAKTCAMLGHKI